MMGRRLVCGWQRVRPGGVHPPGRSVSETAAVEMPQDDVCDASADTGGSGDDGQVCDHVHDGDCLLWGFGRGYEAKHV
jgi:hypothetical protein